LTAKYGIIVIFGTFLTVVCDRTTESAKTSLIVIIIETSRAQILG